MQTIQIRKSKIEEGKVKDVDEEGEEQISSTSSNVLGPDHEIT